MAILIDDGSVIPPELRGATEHGSLGDLDRQRELENDAPSRIYLAETAYLNERMKAQRGKFLVGRLPATGEVRAYSSIDINLLEVADERVRIQRLIDATPGRFPAGGERPPLIVFRIRPAVRRILRRQLAERFGYTTETIYPDLNGFARAFDQYAPIR